MHSSIPPKSTGQHFASVTIGCWHTGAAQTGVAKYTPGQAVEGSMSGAAREALKFVLSSEGTFFREFLMNELVVSIDGMSRQQLALLVQRLNLQASHTPKRNTGFQVFLPLAKPPCQHSSSQRSACKRESFQSTGPHTACSQSMCTPGGIAHAFHAHKVSRQDGILDCMHQPCKSSCTALHTLPVAA